MDRGPSRLPHGPHQAQHIEKHPLIRNEDGLSSDVAYAEPDNRCADMRTADTLATPRVFGNLFRSWLGARGSGILGR